MKLLTNFFKKPLFIQIAFLVALLGIVSLFKLSFNLPGNDTPGLATLVINFETEKRSFEGEVFQDMTILDALNMALSVGKIELNFSIDESGDVSVTQIDGYTTKTSSEHFIFYLNSHEIAVKDINKKELHDGDTIEIRFQKI